MINSLWRSRKEEITLRTVLNSLAEGVIISDQDGRFLFFNRVAEAILGIGPKSVFQSDWSSVYGCFYPDGVTPYPSEELPLAQAIRGKEISNELLFIKNPTKPQGVFIRISGSPLKDASGSIHGGVVIFRDVTESKVTEERMRKLSSVVEQTSDSVAITNRNGVIEYVNPSFEKITGYTSQEAIGQTPRLLKSGVHDKSFYKKLWDNILGGNSFRGTIINRKKSGQHYWSEQSITPIKDPNGNTTNFVSVMKDITELVEKHEQDARLHAAKEIQQRLLRPSISVPGFDIAGATYPAAETSGDYFDLIPLADGGVGMVVGDALGHGIGAAMIMVQARAYVRAFAKKESDPAVILNLVNQELSGDLGDDRFVTLIIARVDPRRKFLDYASAGHVPGYLLNGSGEVDRVIGSTGIPLGINRDWTYQRSESIKLKPKNMLVLFSDGIIELMNRGKIEIRIDQALGIVTRNRSASAQEIQERLYKEIRDLSGGQPQIDDMTCIICKIASSEGEKKRVRAAQP
jgi:sigma-B regulation protein RsbU (phosphoserine phosphatase)